MKKIIVFIVIAFLGLFLLCSCIKANDIIIHEGRCTGSADCSVCSNCSSCGHCSTGGTCGICSGRPSERTLYITSKKRKTGSKANNRYQTLSVSGSQFYDSSSAPVSYYAKKEVVNIYKGPGFEFLVVEKIKQGSKLIEIEENGDWIYVKVWKTGTEGFVFHEDVKN